MVDNEQVPGAFREGTGHGNNGKNATTTEHPIIPHDHSYIVVRDDSLDPKFSLSPLSVRAG